MEELIIGSFKYGLDTRKDVLASQVGTLVACENCNINPGGEVEKRKAFDQFLNTAILDGNGAQGTFGLEAVDVGLMTFGSALVFGTAVTQAQPVLASAMPAGVTYQQLKHPSLVNDSTENYNTLYHRMTEVKFSENFNGKAFVGAKFTDGRTFLYFDGELVQQSANGIVMEGRTALADLANDLARQFDAIDWTATANVDENAVAQNGSDIVKSPPINKFTPLPEETSTLGLFGHKLIGQDGAGTAGVSPSAGFDITVNPTPGVGTITVTAPSEITGANFVDIAGGPITALASAALTAAAIVQAINDLTFIYGYRALISGTTGVLVFADESYGPAFVFELRVAYTAGTVAALVGTPLALTAMVVPNPSVEDITRPIGINSVYGYATLFVTGGSGTYTYLWSEVNDNGGNGIVVLGETASIHVTFKYTVPVPRVAGGVYHAVGAFQCRVRDNVVPPAEVIAYVTVDLTLRTP